MVLHSDDESGLMMMVVRGPSLVVFSRRTCAGMSLIYTRGDKFVRHVNLRQSLRRELDADIVPIGGRQRW